MVVLLFSRSRKLKSNSGGFGFQVAGGREKGFGVARILLQDFRHVKTII